MSERFISQPRRMIACGCASEIARAAASNSASCRPSATSASGVPVIVSGIDQTTLRAGLSFFQMPGTQLNLVEILPGRLAIEVDAQHRRRPLLQPFFPGLQRMLATDRTPIDERAGELRWRGNGARGGIGVDMRQQQHGSAQRPPGTAPAASRRACAAPWISSKHHLPSRLSGKDGRSLRPTSIAPSAVRWPASNCMGMSPCTNSSQRSSRHIAS